MYRGALTELEATCTNANGHRSSATQNCSSIINGPAVCSLAGPSGICLCADPSQFVLEGVCTSCALCTSGSVVAVPCNGTADTVCLPACGYHEIPQYTLATLAADNSTQSGALLTPEGLPEAVTALYVTPAALGSQKIAMATIDSIISPTRSRITMSPVLIPRVLRRMRL